MKSAFDVARYFLGEDLEEGSGTFGWGKPQGWGGRDTSKPSYQQEKEPPYYDPKQLESIKDSVLDAVGGKERLAQHSQTQYGVAPSKEVWDKLLDIFKNAGFVISKDRGKEIEQVYEILRALNSVVNK